MTTSLASTKLDLSQKDYDDTLSEQNEPSDSEAERAMARAQIRAQAFVNRPASTDSLDSPKPWSPLARKKSGELVKSSLRQRPPLARTKSEPMRKAVHFNQKLEDVRPFRKTQRPSAVNPEERKPRFRTGGDSGDSVSDNDEDLDDDSDDEDGWTLLTPGFVPHRYGGMPGKDRPIVYLETLQLTSDRSTVSGSVFVKNISFAKHVAVRYTMDGWKTFSETQGVWNDDVRKHDRDAGYDRFDISLSLRCFSPKVLCDTVMFLCVRYNVNGEEFWDNNNGANYELYLRNSELLHSLSSNDNKIQDPASRPGLSRHRSESSVPTKKSDSVKEILNNAMRETEGEPGLSGPPGIPMKRHSGANKSRYSFEASYAMSPRGQSESSHKPRSRYNVSAVQQLARSWAPHEAAVPMPAELKDTEHSGSTSSLSLGSSGSPEPRVAPTEPQKFHAWESDSYKDFVSKYCFYTPMSVDSAPKSKPAAPSKQTSRSGSPEADVSSSESSDIDLPLRHDIKLASGRELNQV